MWFVSSRKKMIRELEHWWVGRTRLWRKAGAGHVGQQGPLKELGLEFEYTGKPLVGSEQVRDMIRSAS